ncbi:hypothetical protein DW083_19080 [Parabacteroides sp. AF48-14]|nr:hypothetical protein DW083_19080 [Parabacteroides sp. AF48-14]
MKNTWLLILLFICSFFSCRNDRVAHDLMNRAEGFIEADPDSAYTLLNSIEVPDNLNDRQFARWCMLYGQAADKLFKDMPYVIQLNRALHWYKKHGTPEQQAWMGLYLGRSYMEDKLFIPATEVYSEALDLAKEKHLYNVAGYICSYMADLYEYTGQVSEERRKFEEAAEFFKKARNERSFAFALRDISKTCVFDDSTSLALALMLKADSIVTTLNDLVGMASIANGLGNVYASIGEIEKAKSCYQRSFSYDTTDLAPHYLALSSLYYSNDILDSARYYQEKADCPTDNLYTPSDRLYMGYLIEKEANDIPKAFQYLEQFYEAKDSLYDEQKQVDIVDAEKRHNLFTVVKKNRKLQTDMYIVSSVAIFICLVLCVLYQARDRRRLNKINKQQLVLDEKEYQLTELRNEIREKEAVQKEKGETEHEDVELIRNKISQVQKEVIALKCDKLQYSSLFKQIKDRCQKGHLKDMQALSKKDWDSLIALIDSACPNVLTFICNNPLGLTKAEIEICYLSFLGLGLNEEAILLGINTDSVNKRRLRTRQKLNLVNTKTGINEFLISQTL